MFSTAGCSDSKVCDGQHAAEVAQNLLLAALSGGNLIHDVGFMESGNCTSLQALVIADEIIGQVKRIAKGIEVNEETLAIDVIAAVGPGGDYLRQRHTKSHYRKEWFFPTLLNRGRYQEWASSGKPDLAARAQEKLLRIIEEHQPSQLSPEALERVHGHVWALLARESPQGHASGLGQGLKGIGRHAGPVQEQRGQRGRACHRGRDGVGGHLVATR